MNDIMQVQILLNKLGNSLTEDGVSGPLTVDAIKQFQLESNLLPDGRITPELIQALNIKVSPVSVTDSPSFITKIKDFAVLNKKPVIIIGSLGILGYGIWFIKSRFKK